MRLYRKDSNATLDEPDHSKDKGQSARPRMSVLWRSVHVMTGMVIMYTCHTVGALLGPPGTGVAPPSAVQPTAARPAAAFVANRSRLFPEEQLEVDGPFREIRTWGFTPLHSATCEPPPTVAKYGVAMHDIAFGVLTSSRFLETRLRSQQRTWLRLVRNVIFYSESEVASLPTVPLTPPEREALVGGGAWKNFPALLDLHRRFPRQKWIFFTDDDTFVFVRNLMTTLGNYNHDSEYYIGLYWTPRVDMEWKEVQIAYASGGAGYALSRGLLNRLALTMEGCHRNYTRWAGDIRVG